MHEVCVPEPFFNPTEEFLAWFQQEIASAPVIDVGCGQGNLTAALAARGITAIGIDLNADKIAMGRRCYPEVRDRLVPLDSTTSSVMHLPGSVLIFARPCHSQDWIEQSVKQAKGYATRFFYISKPGNAADDLSRFQRKRAAHDLIVGAEGEEVWEFKPAVGPLYRWCLVESNWITEATDVTWLRAGDSPLFLDWYCGWNKGPTRTRHSDDVVHEEAWISAEANATDWLDWTRTSRWQQIHDRVNDTSLTNGWVSPEGRWYRCDYWGHDSLVYDYLLRTTSSLEEDGWAKVQDNGDPDYGVLIILRDKRSGKPNRLTKEQVDTLQNAGIEIPEYLLDDAEK